MEQLQKERQARQKAEDTLAQAEEELEQIIRETGDRAQSTAAQFRSQKMNALGLMAGGVAHDLNNILSGIVSYPDLLLMQLPDDSPLRSSIEIIKEAGLRATGIVADLLTVARGVASTRQVTSLNDVVTAYLDSPEHHQVAEMYPDVVFEVQEDPHLLDIKCSATHVRKTVANLVANGAESLAGEGKVIVSTSNRYLDRPLRGYDTIRPGEYVVLAVEDNGGGIAAQDIERIFEPFYTKRVMGRSRTGLGMAVVWNTIQDHDGYLNVSSTEKGTLFEVYLSATREQSHSPSKDQAVQINEYGQGETLLVVDDQPMQRQIASVMLEELNYQVESCASGEEAVDFIKKRGVDLIILDMIMDPGMNGRQTFEKIRGIRPDQQAIIATGFSETLEVKRAQQLGAGVLMKKPYTLAQLGQAVSEALKKCPQSPPQAIRRGVIRDS